MTIDVFQPPDPKFRPSSMLRRREHLMVEIRRARSHRHDVVRRHALLFALGLVAVGALIPAGALAVANDWWFFRFGGTPSPLTSVVVVETGKWQGKAWELTAYRSSTEGICFALSPTTTAQSQGQGGAMACDLIEGVPRTPDSKRYTPHAITFLAGFKGTLPDNVVGPVTAMAAEVAIYLTDGTIVRTPTLEAPSSLGSSIRFYATALPEPLTPPASLGMAGSSGQGAWLKKVVGLDDKDQVVACLTVPVPRDDVPLSACQ